jgi:hypothetical protein
MCMKKDVRIGALRELGLIQTLQHYNVIREIRDCHDALLCSDSNGVTVARKAFTITINW